LLAGFSGAAAFPCPFSLLARQSSADFLAKRRPSKANKVVSSKKKQNRSPVRVTLKV